MMVCGPLVPEKIGTRKLAVPYPDHWDGLQSIGPMTYLARTIGPSQLVGRAHTRDDLGHLHGGLEFLCEFYVFELEVAIWVTIDVSHPQGV